MGRERPVGVRRAGDHHQAGGVLVEAVHDAGPVALSASEPRQLAEAPRGGRGPGGPLRACPNDGGVRVHHDSGRLVDDYDGLVVVDDTERDLPGEAAPTMLSRRSRREAGGRSRAGRRSRPGGSRPRRRPRTRTPPAAMSLATWARVHPDKSATTRSTRSPESAPGTSTCERGPASLTAPAARRSREAFFWQSSATGQWRARHSRRRWPSRRG